MKNDFTSALAEARWAMARGHIEKGSIPNFHLYLDALLAVQAERVTVMR